MQKQAKLRLIVCTLASLTAVAVLLPTANMVLKLRTESKHQRLRRISKPPIRDHICSLWRPIFRHQLETGRARLSKDRRKVYEFVPNASGLFAGAPYRLNSEGYRDDDYPLSKAAGVWRAAVLGDSCSWGQGLPHAGGIYSEILERMLNGLPDRSHRYEVMNRAVAGYNTLAELAVLEETRKYDLDAVILQFCYNDHALIDCQLDHRFYVTRGMHRIASLIGEGGFIWQRLFRTCLERMKAMATEDETALYLLLYHSHYDLLRGQRGDIYTTASAIAQEFGFTVVDPFDALVSALEEYEQDGPGCFRLADDDDHPNVRQNEAVALAMLQGMLPSLPHQDRDRLHSFYLGGGHRGH